MTNPILLKGMTWSHPRGYDPLVACSEEWYSKTGVRIEWEKRSLQDFESFPVDELAAQFDLIVIDHPHVGQVTDEQCLLPLDVPRFARECADLAANSVGASYPSYTWQGRQWALPIDAATQVQVYAPSRLASPVTSWDDMLSLARLGKVALPMRPPHSLMSFYTLAAHLGYPCNVLGPELIDHETANYVLGLLAELTALIPQVNFDMDPIAIFEDMAKPDSRIVMSPLIYGYQNYAIDGFRPILLQFADLPVIGERSPNGSALGGTGIAVSARTQHPDAALDFAFWVASGDVQRRTYAGAGGQPGHLAAWRDDAVNATTHNFYCATQRTLDGAFVRPRHNGYMDFQQKASELIVDCLQGNSSKATFAENLNALFRSSLVS